MLSVCSSGYFKYVDWIVSIFARDKEMHKSSDEFEIRPDLPTDYGVSYP